MVQLHKNRCFSLRCTFVNGKPMIFHLILFFWLNSCCIPAGHSALFSWEDQRGCPSVSWNNFENRGDISSKNSTTQELQQQLRMTITVTSTPGSSTSDSPKNIGVEVITTWRYCKGLLCMGISSMPYSWSTPLRYSKNFSWNWMKFGKQNPPPEQQISELKWDCCSTNCWATRCSVCQIVFLWFMLLWFLCFVFYMRLVAEYMPYTMFIFYRTKFTFESLQKNVNKLSNLSIKWVLYFLGYGLVIIKKCTLKCRFNSLH